MTYIDGNNLDSPSLFLPLPLTRFVSKYSVLSFCPLPYLPAESRQFVIPCRHLSCIYPFFLAIAPSTPSDCLFFDTQSQECRLVS